MGNLAAFLLFVSCVYRPAKSLIVFCYEGSMTICPFCHTDVGSTTVCPSCWARKEPDTPPASFTILILLAWGFLGPLAFLPISELMDITMGKHSLFGSIITLALIPAIFGVSYYIFFTKTKKHYGKNGLAERGQILITASVGNKIPKAPWLIYKNHREQSGLRPARFLCPSLQRFDYVCVVSDLETPYKGWV